MNTKRFFMLFLAACLLVAGMGAAPVRSVQAQSTSSSGVSPRDLLNADGTLNLNGSFSGSLDLSGYRVEMDAARGPVFSSADGSGKAAPEAALGQWSSLGSGQGVFSNDVSVITVSGNTVYVGGWFKDAAGIPEADAIVKWDGVNWWALGSNGKGDGAIFGNVNAIAASGTDVYVGGAFSNAAGIPEADNIAKFNGVAWSALSSDGNGNGSLASSVSSLAFVGADLYVGGWFTNVNNNGVVLTAADYIARWNGTNWYNLNSTNTGDGSLNGNVNALAVDGNGNLYVGGSFTNVQVGAVPFSAADYIAKWNGLTWSALGMGEAPAYGALNGDVNAIAISGSDIYAGGSFHNVDNKGTVLNTADYIAKFDGTDWSALGSNGSDNGSLNATINAVVINGSNIYVGGNFSDVNNNGSVLVAADHLAKWNGAAWSALGNNGAGNGSLNNPSYGWVNGLAFSGSNLLVGGVFFDVNNGGTVLPQADYLAQWDGSNWASVGSAISGSLNDTVEVVTVSGTDVYVGGNFRNIQNNGINIPEADYIAKWDTLTGKWSALGSDGTGNGSLNGRVYTIAVSGTNVYMGGDSQYIANSDGSHFVGSIARWDGTKWNSLGDDGSGNSPINNTVLAIFVNGSDIYAGGWFQNITNKGNVLLTADYIAKFNGTDWFALGSNLSGDGAITNMVMAITVIGSNVYAGGAFTDAAKIPSADYLAKFDGVEWSAVSTDGGTGHSLNGIVHALAVSGSDLYVGGNFTNVNDNGNIISAADYIAKWDGAHWSALGNDGSDGTGDGVLNDVVLTIAIDGTDIYAGGWFKDIKNKGSIYYAADYVAKFDGNNWSPLGSDGEGNGAINIPVYGIAAGNGNLYAGGLFTNVIGNGKFMPQADFIAAYGLSTVTATIKSTAAQDGWILESGEKTSKGGTINASATTLRLGDDAAKKQYRDTLSFTTQTLPDNAVITKVTLRLKKSAITGGGNPITMFGGLMVDIKKGSFGTAPLQLADFATAANKTLGPFKPTLTAGWYTINISLAKTFINKAASNGGLTQIRLRFKLDDNNNAVANYLSLFSGNAGAASRPQLIIEYYVP